MTEAPSTVPLNKLKFGGDMPGGGINARTYGRHDGLGELGASILAHGLIQPLAVRTVDGVTYVADGNRRLTVLRSLAKDKRIPKDWPVKVAEIDDATDPLEASLAANILQLPMHEVEQYERFAQLVAAGKGIDDIASSFGTSNLMVRRRLALGKLAPSLRQAWREGKMTAEAAQAFTIVEDHELQANAYRSLAQGGMLHRSSIVRALTNGSEGRRAELTLVGKAAYVAAGGRLVEDLFEEEVHVLDADVLKRLARERLEAECRRLVDDGWAWAILRSDAPFDNYRWPQVPGADAEPPAVSPDDRARSGCLVSVGHGGDLWVSFGLVRPTETASEVRVSEDEGQTAEPPARAVAEPETGISGALAQTLSEQLTTAAAVALSRDPDLALRVLVASLRSCSAPARVSVSGWHGLWKVDLVERAGEDGPKSVTRPTFASALVSAETASQADLLAQLALRVARALDLTKAAQEHPAIAVNGVRELVDALDPDDYLAAARRAFDAEEYFDRAPVRVAAAAIGEMGHAAVTGKKGVVAVQAAELARRLGWLPPDLRSRHYRAPRVDDERPKPRRGRKAEARAAAE